MKVNDEIKLGDIIKLRNGTSELDKLKSMITQKKLVIGRVPDATKNEFVEFAKNQYCDDYGMAFKAIWEYFKCDIKFADMLSRITALESFADDIINEAETKPIVTLSGKKIGEKSGK